MTAFLPTDFSERPALADEETISDEELAAILRREQFEADQFARTHGKALLGGIRVKYSDDQERDDHGRFSSGGGDEIVGVTAEDQAATAAQEAADRSSLEAAIYARTGGGDYTEADHKLIVEAVQSAEHDAPVLYRGFAMNESNGWTPEQTAAFTSQLQVGATIETRLGSYTEDPKIVQEFAGVDSYLRPTGGVGSTMPPIEGDTYGGIAADIAREEGFFISPTGTVIQPTDERVILAVQPGAQALNVQPNASPDFAHQAEWDTLGTFRVESVEHTGPVWKVQLAQLDTVEPAQSDDAGDRQNGLPVGTSA